MGQQTKSTKSKPRKRRNDGGNRVVFIIAAVLMVIYLGGRLSNAFFGCTGDHTGSACHS